MNDADFREEIIDAVARTMKRTAKSEGSLIEMGVASDWQKRMTEEFVVPLRDE